MTKNDILKNLSENFGIDEKDAVEIFESYKDALRENIAIMKSKSLLDDKEEVARAAHSIKGCALNCGDEKMSIATKKAQTAAIEFDVDTFDTVFIEIKKLAEEILSE